MVIVVVGSVLVLATLLALSVIRYWRNKKKTQVGPHPFSGTP